MTKRINKHVADFLAYLETSAGASAHTLKAYRIDVTAFLEFMTGRENLPAGGVAQVDRIDVASVRAWIVELGKAGVSRRSTARKIAALRSFLEYLRRFGVIATNPAICVCVPLREKPLPRVLDENEVTRLLGTPELSDPAGLRDRAILEVLYSSGMRVAELAGLDVDQVDFVSGVAVARGKGMKERMVFVGRMALAMLEEYLKTRGGEARGSRPLFLNRLGDRLDPRSIERLVDKAGRRCGFTRKVTPHTLRHSFATHLLDRGADVRSVQELLGHANMVTTQIYTHVTAVAMKAVYDRAHPRAR